MEFQQGASGWRGRGRRHLGQSDAAQCQCGDAQDRGAAELTAEAALFIGANVYRGSSYGGLHPLRVPRVPVVMDLCRELGWLEGRFRTSPRAKPAALVAFHTEDYIAALQRAEATG